jgi:hypothetical protein
MSHGNASTPCPYVVFTFRLVVESIHEFEGVYFWLLKVISLYVNIDYSKSDYHKLFVAILLMAIVGYLLVAIGGYCLLFY